jgi:aspartyl-tRNA(Asn)/glutamyl-tRNA(Gln) amidotransferase subunit A
MTLLDTTLEGAGLALAAGETTSEALTTAAFDRIEKLDRGHRGTPGLNAFLTLDRDGALASAKAADARRQAGQVLGPLDGVPLAVKDIFCTKGVRTTVASKILANYVPPYDATAVVKLRSQGAVLLGKLNMDEFAMGSSNENSAFGPVRNPWDLERTPGGSSGGSAAAVAARLAFGTLGTDTGGSIRQPAALSGVVGLKPTYGRVSRYGVVAFASSLDQVGPFGRTVRDTALQLGAIAGHDPHDSTSIPQEVPDYLANIEGGVKGLRLGVPKEYFIAGIDPEVEAAVRAAIDTYQRLGAEIVEVSLPHTEYATATYYIVATAEASSNLARFDGVRYGHRTSDAKGLLEMYLKSRAEGFGDEVKRRIMLGTYALSAGYYDAYYVRAQKVRALIKRDFDEAFTKVDAIITPTSPTAAFKLGEKTADPLQMYLADIFTISCNLAGLPGLSMPAGFTAGGLPIGVQLLGKALDEATLLRVARAYERETKFHERAPALVGKA